MAWHFPYVCHNHPRRCGHESQRTCPSVARDAIPRHPACPRLHLLHQPTHQTQPEVSFCRTMRRVCYPDRPVLQQRISIISQNFQLHTDPFLPNLMWLYAYGLNATRDTVPPAWKSASCRMWLAACTCLIIGSLAMKSLTLGGIVEHTTWRLYSLPAMSFAWFALIWIIPDYLGKAGVFVTAVLSFALA